MLDRCRRDAAPAKRVGQAGTSRDAILMYSHDEPVHHRQRCMSTAAG